jgi:hypothetical protein
MAFIFVLRTDAALAFGLIAVIDGEFAALIVIGADRLRTENQHFLNGLLDIDSASLPGSGTESTLRRIKQPRQSPAPRQEIVIVRSRQLIWL